MKRDPILSHFPLRNTKNEILTFFGGYRNFLPKELVFHSECSLPIKKEKKGEKGGKTYKCSKSESSKAPDMKYRIKRFDIGNTLRTTFLPPLTIFLFPRKYSLKIKFLDLSACAIVRFKLSQFLYWGN